MQTIAFTAEPSLTFERMAPREQRLFVSRFGRYTEALAKVRNVANDTLEGMKDRGTIKPEDRQLCADLDTLGMAAAAALTLAGIARKEGVTIRDVVNTSLDLLDGSLDGELETMLGTIC